MGDPDFDRAFRVRASDGARAQRALDPGARQGLAGLKPFGELRVAAALRLPDGAPMPLRATEFLDELAKREARGKGSPEVREALAEAARQQPVAVLSYTRDGLRTDPDETRAAIQVLVGVAAALTAASARASPEEPAATPALAFP